MSIRYYIYLISFTLGNDVVTYEHDDSFLSLLAQLAHEHLPGGQEHDSLHLLLAFSQWGRVVICDGMVVVEWVSGWSKRGD